MYFIGSQLTPKVFQFLAIILSDSLFAKEFSASPGKRIQ